MYKLQNAIAVFIFSAIIFVPLPVSHLSLNTIITQFLFKDLVVFVANSLKIELVTLSFDSDSVSLAILLFFLFCISLLALFFKQTNNKICTVVKVTSCYYLIFVLLSYGLNKVFLAQFPKPDANILYSNFGILQKDILYWSVLGLAPFYTFFIGVIECLIAVLLFFKRTRLIGLLLALMSFIYIFIINISFDISVKMYSFLLIIITIYQLFFYQNKIKKVLENLLLKTSKQTNSLQIALKTFVFLTFLSVLLVPYLINIQTNKTASVAYKLESFSCDDNLKLKNIKRLFILSDGFAVFENTNEEMIDYKIVRFDSHLALEKQQNITTFVIKSKNKNGLILEHANCTYIFKVLQVNNLPVFTHKNHLFIDYVP